jgi:hypothetical protein
LIGLILTGVVVRRDDHHPKEYSTVILSVPESLEYADSDELEGYPI